MEALESLQKFCLKYGLPACEAEAEAKLILQNARIQIITGFLLTAFKLKVKQSARGLISMQLADASTHNVESHLHPLLLEKAQEALTSS